MLVWHYWSWCGMAMLDIWHSLPMARCSSKYWSYASITQCVLVPKSWMHKCIGWDLSSQAIGGKLWRAVCALALTFRCRLGFGSHDTRRGQSLPIRWWQNCGGRAPIDCPNLPPLSWALDSGIWILTHWLFLQQIFTFNWGHFDIMKMFFQNTAMACSKKSENKLIPPN